MITYKGNNYDTIREFDCRVLDLGYKEGGGYVTVFPISPKECRKSHSLQSKVAVIKSTTKTTFNIYSDWGNLYTVIIDNKGNMRNIHNAINKAREYGIPINITVKG
jgi:hypothetical protein